MNKAANHNALWMALATITLGICAYVLFAPYLVLGPVTLGKVQRSTQWAGFPVKTAPGSGSTAHYLFLKQDATWVAGIIMERRFEHLAPRIEKLLKGRPSLIVKTGYALPLRSVETGAAKQNAIEASARLPFYSGNIQFRDGLYRTQTVRFAGSMIEGVRWQSTNKNTKKVVETKFVPVEELP